MKRGLTIFFQGIVVLIGISALVFLLWEPQVEGRNVHATFFEIYFKDPFLACVYIASLSFFVGLSQAFKLLGYIRRNEVFSHRSVKATRTIKYCAMILIACIVAAESYFFIVRPGDDIAGGVAIGILIGLVSIVVAITAAVFERTLRSAVGRGQE